MPIPVRCQSCSKALKVPDKYAGKRIKCPGCQASLSVPSGKAKAAKKKPAPVAAPAESDADFLADLDFDSRSAVDTSVQICPKCAAEIPEDEVVCGECGHNLTTGRLDDAVAKRRARRGPDPSEFIKGAFADGLEFLKTNFSLAKKTTFVWALFGTLASMFAVILSTGTKGPIITFWTFLTFLATFAVAGWYWFLSETVVRMTMEKQTKLKRLNIDTFQTLALGIRAVVWPFVMGLPVWILIIGGLILSGQEILSPVDVSAKVAELKAQDVEITEDVEAGLKLQAESVTGKLARLQPMPGAVLGVAYLLMYTLFPIAQVHQVSRYSYKSTVLWELVKVVPANFTAYFFWNFCALVLLGPFIAIFVVLELFGGGGNIYSNEGIHWCGEKLGGWVYGLINGTLDETSLLYKLFRELTKLTLCFLSLGLISMLASMPAIMLMRITGRFGVYNARKLGLIDKMHHGDPAGFWVRYVAFAIDCFCIPFAALIAAREKAQSALSGLFSAVFVLSYMGYPAFLADMFWMIVPVFLVVNGWVYYSVLESGTARASIGKENMKLVAETEAGKQMKLGSASAHFMMSLITLPVFFLTGLDPNKRSLGDRLSKCRVVWKGEG